MIADGVDSAVDVFKSKAEYSGVGKGENSLQTRKCKTAELTVEALKADMKAMQDLRPMILFTDGRNGKEFFAEISKELKPDLYKAYIKDIDDAIEKRKTEKYQSLGFYMMD